MEAQRLLIVEDDPYILKFLSTRLERSGFTVYTASDGLEGLEKARKERPDLIILDLVLPKLVGEEVCRAIREDEDKDFARVPIIMVTAKKDDVDRVIGKVLGANSYLTKPFQPDVLMAEIHKYSEGAPDGHDAI